MTTMALDAPDVVLQAGASDLTIVDRRFTLTLDEGNVPFVVARATIAPNDATYDTLDPTRGRPVKAVVGVAGVEAFRASMSVLERAYDPATNTVELTLVAVDYDLTTYSPATNVNYVTSQSSVRALCELVVQRATGAAFGVYLDGGATDRSFRVFSEAENLAFNPKLATNTAGWQTAGTLGTGASFMRSSNANASYPFQTYARLQLGSGATSQAGIAYVQESSFTAGEQYTFAVYGQTSRTNMMSARLIWKDSDGVELGIRSYASTRSTTTNWNQRFVITATAPANASKFELTFYAGTGASAWQSGDVLYAGGLMILEGDGTDPTKAPGTLHTYFDGVTADTADYHYGWSDIADASTSRRTPLVQRDPEALWWTPGTTAFDFLKPILDAVGLRLFFREDQRWCLVDNDYRLDGQVAVQYGVNLYEAQELVSLTGEDADGFPMNADAVLLRYAWTDPITGVEKTATDTALTAGYSRPYVLDVEQPYPGPGQAKYLLQRLQARRYAITTVVRPDWTVRPGMPALLSLPRRPAQTAYVQAVEWDLQSAQMTVTTKGLIVVRAGTVGNAPITQTIGAVSGTIAAYTN